MTAQTEKVLYSADTVKEVRHWLQEQLNTQEEQLKTLCEMAGLTIGFDTRVHVIQTVVG